MAIRRKIYKSGHSQVVSLPREMLEAIGIKGNRRTVNVYVSNGVIVVRAIPAKGVHVRGRDWRTIPLRTRGLKRRK